MAAALALFSEVRPMATTNLIPLHTGKGRNVATALGRTTDYVKNPEKTDGGEWVSAYECNPGIADQEFLFSKRRYAALTGREKKESDVIAYHLRQSFRPGEIDPAKANKIGYDLAMSLTKGRHAFIVCTHVDKAHIHSHIIFNSTSLDCTRKFRNFWGSSFAIRRISDTFCLENGLSVIENPKPSRGCYGTWLGDGKPLTVRGKLEQFIDAALASGGKDFNSFLTAMRAAGVEVKCGKHLAFKIPDGKRFVRCDALGADYTESAIYERISSKRTVTFKQKLQPAAVPAKPNLLIDIQAKLRQANSPGFERWAKVYNLKEMAKTLIYLQENGLDDYGALVKAADASSKKYHEISDKTKANNERMKEISELQKQIGTYGKTREVYAQYRKLPQKKKDAFYNEHSGDIILCEAAKRYFDSLGFQKLPSINGLKQEYAVLYAENKKLYSDQKRERAKMMELLTAKSNTDRILGASKNVSQRRIEHEEER
jgi:hypothetical protein